MTRKQSSKDPKRHEVLNRMLRDRQAEIQSKLRSLREVLPAEVAEVKDEEEQSVGDFARSMDFALMEMEFETLRKIDEAIHRLERGTYGLCADCGEKIAEARLQALPFALLCRACQEGQEELHAQETARHPALDEGFTPQAGERRRGGRPRSSKRRAPASIAPAV